MKTETHDNFVSEAVRTVKMGHADMDGYFDDLVQRIEIAAIAEHDPWLPYPEHEPENKDSMYYVALKSGGYTTFNWVADIVNLSWNRVLAFRPLPAPYVKGGAK